MLRVVTVGFYLLVSISAASGQNWPERPVRLIVPYAPDGGTDIVARVLAQRLGAALGQPFIVENKVGASGMIGAQTVAKGEANGYTFLVGSSAEVALNQNFFHNMGYDPLKDLTPITLLAWTPLVLAAHPTFAASTPAELVALARTQLVDFSSPGTGSSHHLAGEYINKLQSTKLVHVPYRGAGPAVADAVGGQVKLTISAMPPVVEFVQAGTLKAIAVTSKNRASLFPNIPTMSEIAGFEDFDFANWYGLLARTGTPQFILDKMAKATAASLKDDRVREILTTQAAMPVGSTPAEFRDFIRTESQKYARVVQITGVTLK